MKFTDNQFHYSDAIDLSFGKTVSHESDEVAQLEEEVFQEHFELNFQDTFSSSAQDLAASSTSKELKVEYDMHQGDKVGASAVGESTRSLSKVKLLIFSVACGFQ